MDKQTMIQLTTILAVGFIAIISIAEIGLIVLAGIHDGSTMPVVTDTLVKILFGAIAVFGPVATSIIHVFGGNQGNQQQQQQNSNSTSQP